jgi:hypothetical protein
MQANTVDSNTDACANLGHNAILEISRAERFTSTGLHLREFKVFALFSTLDFYLAAWHLGALNGC